MKKQNYFLTKYPNIYKKTYWGNLIDSPQYIIDNRNEFITKNKIRNRKFEIPTYISSVYSGKNDIKQFDHIEVYETKDAYIIVNSPYCESINNNDFIKINNLYSDDTSTYMLTIQKRKQLKGDKKIKDMTHNEFKEYSRSKINLEKNIICDICFEKYSKPNKSNHLKSKYHKIGLKKINNDKL